MSIEDSKNVVANATIDADDNVIVGDNNKIFNLKEAAQSKALLEELEELDQQLAKTRGKIERYPDDPDFKQDLLRLSKKRNQKQEELDKLKAEILKLAEDFSRIPTDTERLRLAKQHFEEGAFDKARAVLDAELMGQELDALLAEKEKLQDKQTENENQLKAKANEFLILARLTSVDYELADRFEKTMRYFEQSLQAWRTEENVFAFAYFLDVHKQFSKSLVLYQAALEIYQRLAQDNPQRYEPGVAATQNNLGAMYADLNTHDQAAAAYQAALEIYQRLAQANPQRYEPEVAKTQHNLGVMYADLNTYDQAAAAYQVALEIYQRLAQDNPQRYEPDMATTQHNLGVMYADLNTYDQAVAAYQVALEIRKRLAQNNPQRYENDLAVTQNSLGNLYATLNTYDQATAAYQAALGIRKRLAQDNPQRYENDLAVTQNNLGNLYAELNSYDQAVAAYQAALEIRKRLAQDNPQPYERDLAMTQHNLGNLYATLNSYDQAVAAYQAALEIYQRLAQDNPQRYEPYLAATQNNLGVIYADLNSYGQAAAAYQAALEIRKRLAQDNSQRYEQDLAMTQHNLGNLYATLNSYEQAAAAYQAALEIYQRLAQDNPQPYKPKVANTQNDLGMMYADLNSYDQAAAAFQAALEIRKRLAQDNPQRFKLDFAQTLIVIGYLHKALLAQNLNWSYRASGHDYAKQAEAALSFYTTETSIIKRYRHAIAELIVYFEKVTTDDLHVQSQINAVSPIEKKIQIETSPDRQVDYQSEIVRILENIRQEYPQNANIISTLSTNYGGLAWYQLFARQFSSAEQSARKGLELDSTQEWINTNLASALLFQGKYEEAEAIYLSLKDKPFDDSMDFKTAFLQDLSVLEEQGIVHPDLKKVKALLR